MGENEMGEAKMGGAEVFRGLNEKKKKDNMARGPNGHWPKW